MCHTGRWTKCHGVIVCTHRGKTSLALSRLRQFIGVISFLFEAFHMRLDLPEQAYFLAGERIMACVAVCIVGWPHVRWKADRSWEDVKWMLAVVQSSLSTNRRWRVVQGNDERRNNCHYWGKTISNFKFQTIQRRAPRTWGESRTRLHQGGTTLIEISLRGLEKKIRFDVYLCTSVMFRPPPLIYFEMPVLHSPLHIRKKTKSSMHHHEMGHLSRMPT